MMQRNKSQNILSLTLSLSYHRRREKKKKQTQQGIKKKERCTEAQVKTEKYHVKLNFDFLGISWLVSKL